MIYTNLHHTVILGQEYRFQIKGCELECHQRTHGADAAWYPTADPLMLRHLRTVAEDGDRQVLRTRQTADLLRELEQNQTLRTAARRLTTSVSVTQPVYNGPPVGRTASQRDKPRSTYVGG